MSDREYKLKTVGFKHQVALGATMSPETHVTVTSNRVDGTKIDGQQVADVVILDDGIMVISAKGIRDFVPNENIAYIKYTPV